MKPREQGDWGELQALSWLISQGAQVALPYGHSPHYDLIADFHGALLRRGGNRSGGNRVKILDPREYDYLFVAVADGRRWFIPARRLAGGTHITLGGPKYALYEVEPGVPMPQDDVQQMAV